MHWSCLLSAVQVHTQTHCRFYREQHLAPNLIRPALLSTLCRSSTHTNTLQVLQRTTLGPNLIRQALLSTLCRSSTHTNTLQVLQRTALGPQPHKARLIIYSAVQVHTQTHCRFYREQYWAPNLIRQALLSILCRSSTHTNTLQVKQRTVFGPQPHKAGPIIYSLPFKYTHKHTAGFTENSIGPPTS